MGDADIVPGASSDRISAIRRFNRFYTKHVGGRATFLGAVVGEIAVILCSIYTDMAWLWWNVVGCVTGVVAALIFQAVMPEKRVASAA